VEESGDIDRSSFVTRCIYYLSGLGLIAVTFVIFYATVARYFFNAPPFWGEEIAILIFIWMGFLAAGMAIDKYLKDSAWWDSNAPKPAEAAPAAK